MMRKSTISRDTKETQIELVLNLDKKGSDISTSIEFFDHLLILFAKHAGIQLNLKATGDLKHHLIEDVGIVLGKALEEAVGDKVGIERYGTYFIPMDETLAFCSLDLSGRPYFVLDLKFTGTIIEDTACEDIVHFFESLCLNAKMNLHVDVKYGHNDHHKAEGAIKALAHALKMAISITSDELLSTKGKL